MLFSISSCILLCIVESLFPWFFPRLGFPRKTLCTVYFIHLLFFLLYSECVFPAYLQQIDDLLSNTSDIDEPSIHPSSLVQVLGGSPQVAHVCTWLRNNVHPLINLSFATCVTEILPEQALKVTPRSDYGLKLSIREHQVTFNPNLNICVEDKDFSFL